MTTDTMGDLAAVEGRTEHAATHGSETTEDIIARLEGSKVLLQAENLDVTYVTEEGEIPACREINLELRRGEILGVAGESASGKSTLLNALARLQRPPAVTSAGSVTFYPVDDSEPMVLTDMTEEQLRKIRWTNMSMVMQSAMACLNPVMRLDAQFIDAILEHEPEITKLQAQTRTGELLEMVGIPAHRMKSYPYQLSGGMQQRALIALSLACNPDIVFMDEPTTAVDVIMQRQILGQMLKLQRQLGFAVVFVTHDLSLLLEISDRVAIMYAGRVVEVGHPEQLFVRAQHPYTRGLRQSFPPLTEPVRRLKGIPGTPPDLLQLPPGCPFAERCPEVFDKCHVENPPLVHANGGEVACWLTEANEIPIREALKEIRDE